ncbi:MAG TPA: ADP-ribosylglycohydrolase family protein, partial [Verrucomicrobiae bacterium]|nr:ADP-ribosylglycohydrolase family protein [Verrucomicrobiae bacterium]
ITAYSITKYSQLETSSIIKNLKKYLLQGCEKIREENRYIDYSVALQLGSLDAKLEKKKDIDVEIDPLYKGAGNCSAARSSCLGLAYNKLTRGKKYVDELISISIETGKVTNPHPIGYLGSFTIAYFVSLCFENEVISAKAIYDFPFKLMKILESGKIEKYLQKNGGLELYNEHKNFFIDMWKKYINNKFEKGNTILTSYSEDSPLYNPAYRSKYYAEEYGLPSKTRIYPGMGGQDSTIIAYDCLLDCIYPSISWEKLVTYSMLHMGDSDATGAMAASMFGAIFGFQFITNLELKDILHIKDLVALGEKLFKLTKRKK